MKDLKKLDKSLDKLHNDFNIQLNELGNDTKEFHDAMIDLSAKYPDHKELLQFIVHINDKLETNHTLFSGIMSESFNDLIEIKKEILGKMIEDKEMVNIDDLPFWQKTVKMATNIKDIKVIMFYIVLLVTLGGAAFAPDALLAILHAMAKIAL